MFQIKTFKPESHKIKALLYGASSVGKTRLAATAPNPIFANAENGMLSIKKKTDYVSIKKMDDLRNLRKFLETEKHKYETVVIDSITEINEIIKTDIELSNGRPMQIQDWGQLSKTLKGIFNSFRDLDMHVIFIAQEDIIKDEDKVHKITPMLNGKTATEIAYFMDIVGYMYIDIDGEHKIKLNSDTRYLSKDRTDLLWQDPVMDISEWIKKAKEGIKIGKQEVVFMETKEERQIKEHNALAPSFTK